MKLQAWCVASDNIEAGADIVACLQKVFQFGIQD
jgi:hypothetical protein